MSEKEKARELVESYSKYHGQFAKAGVNRITGDAGAF